VPLVRPEYGPSLGQLAGPRFRALPGALRAAVATAGAVILVALVVVGIRGENRGLNDVLVREPIAFTLAYKHGLHKVAPQRDEVLRLQTAPGAPAPQSFTARPLHLGTYAGDVTADLLRIASARLAQLRQADPGLAYRGEGKARINFIPAYQLSFQTRRDGRLVFGKLYFLAPTTDSDTHPADGIEVELLSPRTGAIPSVSDLGANGLLKTPLRSFRFGTERP
jgi:hypothetical protein